MMLNKLGYLIFTEVIFVIFLCRKSNAVLLSQSVSFSLPRDIQPINYDLEIFTPFSNPPTFRGKVCITVKCKKNTDRIVLHQEGLKIEKNIQIKHLPIVTNPPSMIDVLDREYDSKSKLYTIKLKENLEKDTNYEIEMEFSGNFSQNLDGFISFDSGGRSGNDFEQIISPWMGKSGARRIFPCFDELGMKATFNIRIGHPSTFQGFSNASFRITEPASSPQYWLVDEFERTVAMEASAVTIIVAEPLLSPKTLLEPSSNTEIRIFTKSSDLQELIGAIIFDIFHFFLNQFKVSYALKKLDVFLSPEFPIGVKSSYGVIYLSRTTALAALENKSGVAGYEMVSALCHAISKQWIGFAATMTKLLDDYLHTALNLFLQILCVQKISSAINPKWQALYVERSILVSRYSVLEFFEGFYQPVLLMGMDSTLIFDYGYQDPAKPYHLIRMVHAILGQSIFENSITNYLKKFEFGNSSANDLWDVFTNTAMEVKPDLLSKHNLNIGGIVGLWIDQTGFPLVNIRRDDKNKRIYISQRPFYSFDDIKPEDKSDSCWIIPLNYTTKSKSKSLSIPISQWSTCKEPLVMDIDIPQDDWVLFDVNVVGRINYDKSNWKLIQKALVSNGDSNVFDALTRARLTSDMFALANVGELSYKIVLNAMKYLSKEVHFDIFELALYEFDRIYSLLVGSSISKSFKKYVRGVLEPVFSRHEFKNLTEYQTATNVNFKSRITDSSCRFGVRACIKQSLKIINEWKHPRGKSPDLPKIVHDTVHCQAIKYGDQKHWDFMWKLSKDLKGEQRRDILRALTCSSKKKLLKKFLNWSINAGMISREDSFFIFQGLTSNPQGYKIMKRFFISNYDRIKEFLKSDSTFALYWISIFDATVKEKDLQELEDLAISKGVAIMTPTDLFYKNHENAKKNVAWFRRNMKTFDEYFGIGILNLGFSF